MVLRNQPRYSLEQVKAAADGVPAPVRYGYAVGIGQEMIFARTSDNAMRWNPGEADPLRGKVGVRWHDPKMPFFIEHNQAFVMENLTKRPDSFRTPAQVRALIGDVADPIWLDRRPYKVLLQETDLLIGRLEYRCVLIVRGETLMAGIYEPDDIVGIRFVSGTRQVGGNG